MLILAIGCAKSAQKDELANDSGSGDDDNNDSDSSTVDDDSNGIKTCFDIAHFKGGMDIHLGLDQARPGEEVTVAPIEDHFPKRGENSYVILSGLRILPKEWTSSKITFDVPQSAVSGPLYVRFSNGKTSEKIQHFKVIRGFDKESEPKGLKFTSTGINGVAMMIETDGDYLYSVTGSNALTTYQICQGEADEKTCPLPSDITNYDEGYNVRSRIYFPQRLMAIELFGGCLFCVGSFGLEVFTLEELKTNASPEPVAAIAGAGFHSVAVKAKNNEIVVAMSEHVPQKHTRRLRAQMYSLNGENGEMSLKWEYSSAPCQSCTKERLFGIAIDSVYDKVYLGKAEYNLLGTPVGKIEEIVYKDAGLENPPILDYTTGYGNLQIPWMLQETHASGASHGRLWSGILYMGGGSNESFKVYETSASSPLELKETINMRPDVVHAERFAILDDQITVGMNNSIGTPDVSFLNTQDTCGCKGTACSCWATDYGDSADAFDWPHDIAVHPTFPGEDEYDGRIFIIDEWGGILTYPYKNGSPPTFDEQGFEGAPEICQGILSRECSPTYYKYLPERHIHTGGPGGPAIHLTDERVYIGARGGGLWSVDRRDISEGAKWKWAPWQWQYFRGSDQDPEPRAITGMRARKYSPNGDTFIVARGHNKAVNWGAMVVGILYKENKTGIIEELAHSRDVQGNYGLNFYTINGQVVWPEPDLAYISTYHKGVHAYVVDPREGQESIDVHVDSPLNQVGFVEKPTGDLAVTIKWHEVTNPEIAGQMLVGFLGGSGLHRYDVSYTGADEAEVDEFEGVPPNRDNPNLHISFDNKKVLSCLKGKDVDWIDVTETGVVAASTSNGLAVFSISAFDGDQPTWNEVKINAGKWGWSTANEDLFGPKVSDNGFGHLSFDEADSNYLYVLNNGLWRLAISQDLETGRYKAEPVGYYPALNYFGASRDFVGTGMVAWGDPDIPTLHQPIAVVGDVGATGDGSIFVTTWPGTVQQVDLDF
ncbi:MAG: hypothetical protein GY847_16235 [Proteobacteria bacterium]|nr:hypothetical protein [Pseudomonadota bacterium]